MTTLFAGLFCLMAAAASEQAELLNTFRAEFVAITPGEGQFPKSFSMGGTEASEQPAHEVTFDYDFEIAKYEVPQNLYQAVMETNPSRWKGERNSVERVSYSEACEFCRRATQLLRSAKLIDEDQEVRLPSEAEWEYAARAGTKGQFSFGDDVAQLTDYAWYTGNAAGNDPPVGAKKPNPWGLYDMHGYVWEWCLDSAHENYAGAPATGAAWMDEAPGARRVVRGGSWKDEALLLRSAARRFVAADFADDAVGFRCVLVKVK